MVVLTYAAESDPLPHEQVISTHCLQNRVGSYAWHVPCVYRVYVCMWSIYDYVYAKTRAYTARVHCLQIALILGSLAHFQVVLGKNRPHCGECAILLSCKHECELYLGVLTPFFIWANHAVSLRYGQHYAMIRDTLHGITHFPIIYHLYLPMYIRVYMLYMHILSSGLVMPNVRQIHPMNVYCTYIHCILFSRVPVHNNPMCKRSFTLPNTQAAAQYCTQSVYSQFDTATSRTSV